MTSVLRAIPDWKSFERFCADLLSAEGFIVDSEPSVDHTGTDIVVWEDYRSHETDRVIRVHWRVQCKHYANSGRNLGRKDVEKSLFAFDATRQPDEGLFFIVSTDYGEQAKEVIDQYLDTHKTARITLWNQRQILARLERHPEIARRYGLSFPPTSYLDMSSYLQQFTPTEILLISDQSALAHNIASILRRASFELVFLPHWNYQSQTVLQLMMNSVLDTNFRLIICFLGDTFRSPLPSSLTHLMVHSHSRGASILLFPFMAWSLSKGLNASLSEICPVHLLNPHEAMAMNQYQQIRGEYRRGDFRELLQYDSFAEDQYTELDPRHGKSPFTNGISSRFGVSHSFEYLRAKQGSNVAWADITGNPVVITGSSQGGRVCYLNSCCHSCVSSTAVSSPVEASLEFAILLRNILAWLLRG